MATLLRTLPQPASAVPNSRDALAGEAHRAGLRVALFSGNFNYQRDGANMTLNRLVGFLVRLGIPVRVYSPTARVAAFPPAGPLVSVPSLPIPLRPDYRFALGLPRRVQQDLESFSPTVLHLSAPDLLGRAAQRYAARRQLPMVASYHTRFETYLGYYGLARLEPTLQRYLTRFYSRCDQLLATTAGMAAELADSFHHPDIRLWGRGVDCTLFDPARRSSAWRHSLGLAETEIVIGFTGRLVREKGLEQLVAVARSLAATTLPHRWLIVGDGPEQAWLQQQLPQAVFTGFLAGPTLATAYAAMDVFYNPSTTETFGNVTLEAMASGVPVVAVRASGNEALVVPGVTGLLPEPDNVPASVGALLQMGQDASLRSAMSHAARSRSRLYDWDDILASVVRNYLDALQRPR